MKKWPIFLAGAALVVIGCGGGGKSLSGNGTTTTGSTSGSGSGSGLSTATVNLPTTVGLLNLYYLTGQGRAPGDITATIANAVFTGSTVLQNTSQPALNVLLDAYTQNTQPLDVTGITNSSYYTTFGLQISSITDPSGTVHTGPNNTYFVNSVNGSEVAVPGTGGNFPAEIGVFPGRQTSVQIYLNDATIAIDTNTGDVNSGDYTFYRSQFLSDNTTSDNPYVQGFLSDYGMFDITNVTNKPKLSDGTNATQVYFSGEDRRYGASGSAAGGLFTVYTPIGTLTGTLGGANTLPPPPTGLPPITQGGTYTVKDPDPRDLTGGSYITALQGIWRPVTSVFNGLGTFEVITMPHITDDNFQDIIIMVRSSSGSITNMYYGIADLTAGTFEAEPIATLATGTPSTSASNPGVVGTISSLLDVNGSATSTPANARSATYTFTGTTVNGGASSTAWSASAVSGFRTTGRLIVFRE